MEFGAALRDVVELDLEEAVVELAVRARVVLFPVMDDFGSLAVRPWQGMGLAEILVWRNGLVLLM